jgi:dienelactone hydrolase
LITLTQYRNHINIPVAGKHHRNIHIDVTAPWEKGDLPVVVFAHGFKGFKDWGPYNEVARYFADEGFLFVKFNFSYNGTTLEHPEEFADLEAFGNNNFTRELDDLDSVINWIHSEKDWLRADVNRISLTGHSRGGGMVILKAAEDARIRSIATWAAVSDFSRFLTMQDIEHWKKTGVHYVENYRTGQQMPLYLQLYHDFVSNQHRLHIRSAVERLNIPLLVVHGNNDETVSFEQALELHAHNPEITELFEIEGGDHTFGAVHPFTEPELPEHFQRVVEKTAGFFKKHNR